MHPNLKERAVDQEQGQCVEEEGEAAEGAEAHHEGEAASVIEGPEAVAAAGQVEVVSAQVVGHREEETPTSQGQDEGADHETCRSQDICKASGVRRPGNILVALCRLYSNARDFDQRFAHQFPETKLGQAGTKGRTLWA